MSVSHAADIEAVCGISVVPRILETVLRLTGMGYAAVTRISDLHWVACSVRDEIGFGAPVGTELPTEETLCNEIRLTGEPIVVPSAGGDYRHGAHPALGRYGMASYIAMPILLPDGRFFGTLLALDRVPRPLDRPELQEMFRIFAELIGFHLQAGERLAASEAQLADERHTGGLREQFLAVVGHDLRSPLSALGAGIELLARKPGRPDSDEILEQMQGSVERMAALIGDVLDFARGRLGGGLVLERRTVALAPLLQQAVAEHRAAHPGQRIELDCDCVPTVDCDPRRLAQLLGNLLGNALTHGASDAPVRVACRQDGAMLALSVANRGDPIPEAARPLLFHPFVRGRAGRQQGLGLGLYIAAEIARAHGGTLEVESGQDRTVFTLHLPLAGPPLPLSENRFAVGNEVH